MTENTTRCLILYFPQSTLSGSPYTSVALCMALVNSGKQWPLTTGESLCRVHQSPSPLHHRMLRCASICCPQTVVLQYEMCHLHPSVCRQYRQHCTRCTARCSLSLEVHVHACKYPAALPAEISFRNEGRRWKG